MPPAALLQAVDVQQRVSAYERLRKEMGRLRVPVVRAAEQTCAELILNQVELVRSGRIRA
jgi:hypothetical protein